MSALENARDAMSRHGIHISLPSDGDLDDLELERYQALVAAVEPQEAMKKALQLIYDIADGSQTINSFPHIKRIALDALYRPEVRSAS